ncbi:MarR family winged helix-turn-helix transcriptional regulator [Microbacterium sp. No. 7]|uniref:MarR family winged helix-turn-helix transcriptional regulator n=1 Tax=Microbacterium sp. No. 7 TaxID=1714373 RepID=UPI0006CFAFA8|nr:MarR family transcriptional regulator [Microbacterium sp. No. 7]ALJ18501.1 transcriptional regulator [Microbacterium sp. No. 7]
MDASIARIEREFMLIGRHQTAISRHPDGIHRSAITLLACLDAGGPMSIAELAAALGLDASTLNRQTSSLCRTGLAERIPDPDGGIARKFRITAEGTRRLRQEREANRRILGRLLNEWDADDLAALAELLERLNTEIEAHSGRPWPRT